MDDKPNPRAAQAVHSRGPRKRSFSSPHPILWLSLVGGMLYLISPCFTALNLVNADGTPTYYPGWTLLFFGWFGVISSMGGESNAIGWLANPSFAFGMIALALGRGRIACGLMVTAALFSLTSFWLHEVPINEAGGMATVVGHDVGFWIWMTAIWFNLVVSVVFCLLPASKSIVQSNPD